MSEQPPSSAPGYSGFSGFSAIPESRGSSMELPDADQTIRAQTTLAAVAQGLSMLPSETTSNYALTESQEDLRGLHTRHPSLPNIAAESSPPMPRSFKKVAAPKQHETAFSSFSYTNYSVLSELGLTKNPPRPVNEKESN